MNENNTSSSVTCYVDDSDGFFKSVVDYLLELGNELFNGREPAIKEDLVQLWNRDLVDTLFNVLAEVVDNMISALKSLRSIPAASATSLLNELLSRRINLWRIETAIIYVDNKLCDEKELNGAEVDRIFNKSEDENKLFSPSLYFDCVMREHAIPVHLVHASQAYKDAVDQYNPGLAPTPWFLTWTR